jgi:hypothetical protein
VADEDIWQFIVRSLTVDNVPYEIFSTFSAAFEEVRKVNTTVFHDELISHPLMHEQVQVKFFLDNWSDIRSSDAMRSVWQQIRIGRHPGYEEGKVFLVYLSLFKSLTLRSLACDCSELGV